MSPICIICGHPTHHYHDEQFSLDYYFCPECEFVFQDRGSLISHEAERSRYATHHNSIDDTGYVKMFEEWLQRSELPIEGGRSALDFGCGPGPDWVLARILEHRGYAVDTYDPYFTRNALPQKSYDLITATEVFEHLSDPLSVMQSLKSRLKPGAVLAVMTLFHPVGNSENPRWDGFKDWWYRRDETHVSFYTPRTFEVLGRMCGLDVLTVGKKNSITLSNGRV